MDLKVDITGTELFKDMLEYIVTLLEDERIDHSIRQEYSNKIKEIKIKHNKE